MQKKGARPKVLLDEYTLKILKVLFEKDYSILELSKKLDVAYNNLLKKLEYLEMEEVIERDHSTKGRTVIIKLSPDLKRTIGIFVKKVPEVTALEMNWGLKEMLMSIKDMTKHVKK